MTVEPVVQISALEHYQYCPRQCALIHVDGVWSDNAHVVRGHHGHRRVDSGDHRTERGRRVLRSVPLWSEQFGLTGRADAVEVHDDGRVVPVEYKMGVRHGITAHVQLAAQALCLEEMTGRDVSTGGLWFSAVRRREAVSIDDHLRGLTLAAIEEVRAMFTAARLPQPPNDQRCRECQLLGHCLPGVVADPQAVAAYAGEVICSGS